MLTKPFCCGSYRVERIVTEFSQMPGGVGCRQKSIACLLR
jgi:hypothetical protein